LDEQRILSIKFNALKPKLVKIIFKYSVRTAKKKTPHFTITKINTLLKETIAGYCENHMIPMNTLCGQNAELLIFKAGGIYSYYRALKD
jgi:hypothetical protein